MDFLTRPYDYTLTPRTGTDMATYATPIEYSAPRERGHHPLIWMGAGLAMLLALIALIVLEMKGLL